MDKITILHKLEEIWSKTDHNIPFYAYGDNEAACALADRLEQINGLCQDLTEMIIIDE